MWPAVEWNIWDGWLDLIHLQFLFYAAFFAMQMRMRARDNQCECKRERSPRGMAIVGLICCAVLRGPFGAVLTTLLTAAVRKLALSCPRRWAVRACWVFVLLLMQVIFVGLRVDTPEEPSMLESALGWQDLQSWAPQPLSWLMSMTGLVSWSYFRYDALRLISFANDVNNEKFPDLDDDLWSLLAYNLYPPLAVAGPVMGYSDFVSQLKNPKEGWTNHIVASDFVGKVLPIVLVAFFTVWLWPFPTWLGPEVAEEQWQTMPSWTLFGAL